MAKENYYSGNYFSTISYETDYSWNSVRQFIIRPDAIRFGARYAPDDAASNSTSGKQSMPQARGTQ